MQKPKFQIPFLETYRPHICVDLDGTLAFHQRDSGVDSIGEPIPRIVKLIKTYLSRNVEVRIFTARAFKSNTETDEEYQGRILMIKEWLWDLFLEDLPIVNYKNFQTLLIYDDRAIQVKSNEGVLIDSD